MTTTFLLNKTTCLLLALTLAGCGTLTHRETINTGHTESNQTVSNQLEDMRQNDRNKSAPVREIDSVWLGAKTVKVARHIDLPAVFNQTVAFQFSDSPNLLVLADRISKMTGIPVRVTPDALISLSELMGRRGATSVSTDTRSMNEPKSANLVDGPKSSRRFIIDMSTPFNGTLSDLLDRISAQFLVGWDYNNGSITISRVVTRTYQISNLLDTNDLTANISKTASTGTGSSNNSGSGSSTNNNGSASSDSDVSSKIVAKLDATKGLETAIQGLLTPKIGHFALSSSGIVSVTDTREVQEQVRELVDAENKAVGRQVRLRVQVVQVETNQTDDLGVDWSSLIDNVARKWNVNFSAPTNGIPESSSKFGQIGVIRNGAGTTKLFLQALSELGKVNIVRDESYLTLNNRMLSVATTDNFIYPARSTPAISTIGGAVGSSVGVEPGQLTTGTFLNLRASIQPNGSVITQMSLDISHRGRVETIEDDGITLQFPQFNGSQYQIYASTVSGDTAVLTGVLNVEQNGGDRSFDAMISPLLGGGMSASTVRRAVLILLTPIVVEGVN